MPTFITIGYGDQAGYDRTDPPVRDAAHECDDRLAQRGARIGRAGSPVRVRNPEGRAVQRDDGAYMTSELPVAGFMVIEADSLDHAISLVAGTPCAVAHGVVEVWPLRD
ncbi:YciI family protein [Nesterenkonia haasae]|uniref:YciI family protein n=1 Tax=Nesterenkonia haasae TaxID=2587813 RepID=UPI0013907642|nr:YciI family protein [Nesterenkonia haasae]NDK33204.1 transcription initiation protein [Nesterenkonia haasae]